MTTGESNSKQCWLWLKHKFKTLLFWLPKFIFEASFATIIGIFVLAGTFAILSQLRPEMYRWLTGWANQPALPLVTRCTFTPLSNDLFEVSASTASLKKYSVTFDLDTSIEDTAYAIAHTDDVNYGLYPEGYNEMPKSKDAEYLVLPRRNYGEQPLTIRG